MTATGKTFFFTIGFDATSIMRLVGERGLASHDEIVVLTTSQPHPRSENAVKSVKELVERLNPRAQLRVLRLDEDNVEENISLLASEIARRHGNYKIVDVTGGPKVLSIALYIAALIAGADEILLTSEVTGERVQLPYIPLGRLATPRQLSVLRVLPATLQEVASRLQVSKPAASRILRRMAEKGLVKLQGREYHPTRLAAILLETSKH
ncbi:MAG: CRISPR-associated CARF protein Csa3 [Infirmifilum sp.]